MSDAATPHARDLPFDPQAFFRHTTLDEVVAGHQPFPGFEEFIIEDLTEEESKAFWEALGE